MCIYCLFHLFAFLSPWRLIWQFLSIPPTKRHWYIIVIGWVPPVNKPMQFFMVYFRLLQSSDHFCMQIKRSMIHLQRACSFLVDLHFAHLLVHLFRLRKTDWCHCLQSFLLPLRGSTCKDPLGEWRGDQFLVNHPMQSSLLTLGFSRKMPPITFPFYDAVISLCARATESYKGN